MPVEFLTKEQEIRYGKYNANPYSEQLAKYFWFDDQDRILIFRHRGNHSYLSYAIQLGTVRFLGTFVKNIDEVPQVVINYICKQLNVDIKEVSTPINNKSLWIHSQEIRKAYVYSDFSDHPTNFRLTRWLYTRARLTSERSSILFDLATAKCVEEKILLPGVTVMARLIAKTKDRTNKQLFTKLSNLPDKNQLNMIENLIEFDTERKKTPLDILRTPPRNVTAGGILKAISRLEELRLLESQKWNLSGIPFGKIETLARYSSMARAQTISQMNYDRKIATLVAFTIVFTKNAQDDVIDIMEQLFTKLFNNSVRKEQKSRIRTIKDLDSAARKLKDACALLLDESLSNEDIRETIFSAISKEELKGALTTVDKLTKNPKQPVASKELFRNYSTIRRFLPKLFMVLEFKSTSSGESALSSWNFLASIESKKGKNKYANAPLDRITASWKKLVVKSSTNKINPCAYTFWVIEKVLEALKNRDIFIECSYRYGDPRAQLLQGDEWKAIKPNILRTLNLPMIPEEKINSFSKELDSLYKEVANRWPNNPNARIETFDGHDRLVVTPLDHLPESESLKWLRKSVQLSMPHIDLPELVLELNNWTNFTEAFTHISEGNSKLNDLHISICALLISRACNIGLNPVVQPGIQALEYDRLTWVNQNYFRSETIKKANDILVEFNSKLDLAQKWGGGEVASADGLRFVTPSKSINSRHNSKYFGVGRGVTYYNFVSDQFTGFNAIVIPGTIRDSLYLLQGILEHDTVLNIKEVMTDTAGYSDIIFGLFGLLGYQFSPRIADIGNTRFWRIDSSADYGVLNNISKNKIRIDLIVRYWEDILKVVGSLKTGNVNPVQLIPTFKRGNKITMLGRAFGEVGRIYKTQHLLSYVDIEDYQRKILTQLNRGESRHNVARSVFYGKKGQLYQSYREGQENQLDALGFIVNAIIVWNTRYMQESIEKLRASGAVVNDNEIQRLSALGYDHINIMGKYSFEISEAIDGGKLRSLVDLENQNDFK